MLGYKIITIVVLILVLLFLIQKRNKIKKLYYLIYFKPFVYSNINYSRELNYRLFTPKNKKGGKYPLILYLHPWGHGGTDNKSQISELIYTWVKHKSQKETPCYILAPQCLPGKEWADKGPMKPPFKHYNQDLYPETEEMKMIVDLIKLLIQGKHIDSSRVYCIGYSMGATGTWDVVTRYPDIFAAAIVASGVSDKTKAYKLKDLPVWAFSGENDNVAPAYLNMEMIESINKNGGRSKFTLLKNKAHGIGAVSFNFEGVRNWLFSQRKE